MSEETETSHSPPVTLLRLCFLLIMIPLLMTLLFLVRLKNGILMVTYGVGSWVMAALLHLLGAMTPEDFVDHFIKQETEDCMRGQPLEDVPKYARVFKVTIPWWIHLPPIEKVVEQVERKVRWQRAMQVQVNTQDA